VIFTTSGVWGLRSPAGSVDANPSTVVVGAAGLPYRVSHASERPQDTTFCVEFTAPASSTDTDETWDRGFARVCVPRTAAIAGIESALAHEATARPTGFALKIDGLSVQLVAELARAADVRPAPRPSGSVRRDLRDRVHAARSYLDANLVDDVDLHTLSHAVALSPFYLSRLFRREFGIPPHAYLSRARLERGAELLATTPLTVTQVSERVGWRSVSHFSARFRRHYGITPSAYRRVRTP
jgi:AraC-like DNA-binding protein